VTATELELGVSQSHAGLSLYGVDSGLQSESVKGASHSSHTAMMIDLLPSSGVSCGTDVNYSQSLDSSLSIISLLNDKLDSQSKATIVYCLLTTFPLKSCLLLVPIYKR